MLLTLVADHKAIRYKMMNKAVVLTAMLSILILLIGAKLGDGGYQIGDKAADFQLKDMDGKMVSMAGNPSAKGYIVVFTSNMCPFAQAYENRLIALHKKYSPQGYPVLAINANDPRMNEGDSYANLQERSRDKKYPFAYVVDETGQIARAYGATRTPHVFIVKKQNNEYIVHYIGAIDDNSQNAADVKQKYVEEAVEELIAGKRVTTAITKAIGCTIKWKNT
jgi:peroxiredoxin